uniref:Putative ovule protein n=1 Tax=Solanum chacoense TaxID=4108 RepID=A0A0V0GMF6_SOLCH
MLISCILVEGIVEKSFIYIVLLSCSLWCIFPQAANFRYCMLISCILVEGIVEKSFIYIVLLSCSLWYFILFQLTLLLFS